MPNPSLLTLDKIRQYIDDPVRWLPREEYEFDALDYRPATRISPAAARYLVATVGVNLGLDDLQSLSPAAARELANCNSDLSFYGLKSLNPTIARALAGHRGCLYLNGLRTLTLGTAKALSLHAGPLLSLEGLKELTPAAEKALQCHQGILRVGGYQWRLESSVFEPVNRAHEEEVLP